MPSKYVTDRKLWLTADRGEVVEDGDPRAAFLLASKGKALDAETVERYGLADKPGKGPKGKADKPAGDDAEGKAVAGPPENKAVKAPPATKGKE